MLVFLLLSLVVANVFPAYADEIQVEISAEGDTAKLAGCPFAIDDFSRAQKGSPRAIDGEYRGYHYLSAETAYVVAIATEEYVVVYVPDAEARAVGFSLESASDQESFKLILSALDEKASKGATRISTIDTWYFTSDVKYIVGDVVFSFENQQQEGQIYAAVVGRDGSDVTDVENPFYTSLSFADFGRLTKSQETEVAVAKEGFEALIDFLEHIDYDPLWVTLRTTGTAIIFIFILGLAAAYFSLRLPSRVQDVADSIFTIPMVLPPTVCGFLLLLAFGKNSAVGQWFIDVGFPLVFSWQATVLAAIVVAFPLMYRSARGAFEGLDSNMLDAARTLGWSNRKIFFKLMLPLSWSSIAAGTVLAFARALGEFGATLFLAGNYAGVTRTIPIAIYFEWMNGRTDVALFWTIVVIIISFIVILFINLWSRRTTKYRRRVEE